MRKICPRCRRELSLESFHIDNSTSCGRQSTCRECSAARTRERRQARRAVKPRVTFDELEIDVSDFEMPNAPKIKPSADLIAWRIAEESAQAKYIATFPSPLRISPPKSPSRFYKYERATVATPAPVTPPDPLKRVLFVPDTHVPYHDPKAWALVLKAARLLKPDTIVLLGDFADFYAVSSHDKNPERAADLQYEIGIVKEKLDELEKLDAGHKIYIAGNHEDRLERYLMQRAPALFGTVKIPEVLDLHERGWQYVPYRASVRVGKLHITHDTGKAGQNAHRAAMASFQGSTIIGHTHRLEVSVMGNADGPAAIAAMFGWLGDFDKVDYMHQIEARRNWVHGFGVGFMEPNGVVHLQAIPIVNGKCVLLGQLIE